MKVTQQGKNTKEEPFSNVEIYHKQMSVLPYASSITGVAIRPTKEGVIKHKALSAMEEQTNMQLDQIKQQIELLARQAQEINKRKELSLMIYEATLKFKPQIGHTYHVYETRWCTYFIVNCSKRMGEVLSHTNNLLQQCNYWQIIHGKKLRKYCIDKT